MDCTSCARSIETYLTKLEGITGVDINYASETGEVLYNPKIISRDKIKEEVKTLGYELSSEDEEYEAEQIRNANLKKQKNKIIVSVIFSLLIMAISMKEHLPVINLIPVSENANLILLFFLTTIVIFWCGDKFLKGAYTALRNKTSDMNTLITMGSLASYLYSIIIASNIVFGLGIISLADSHEVY